MRYHLQLVVREVDAAHAVRVVYRDDPMALANQTGAATISGIGFAYAGHSPVARQACAALGDHGVPIRGHTGGGR